MSLKGRLQNTSRLSSLGKRKIIADWQLWVEIGQLVALLKDLLFLPEPFVRPSTLCQCCAMIRIMEQADIPTSAKRVKNFNNAPGRIGNCGVMEKGIFKQLATYCRQFLNPIFRK